MIGCFSIRYIWLRHLSVTDRPEGECWWRMQAPCSYNEHHKSIQILYV